MSISLSSQIAALDAMLRRATPAGFVRAGMAMRLSEGEMMLKQIRAALETLRGC